MAWIQPDNLGCQQDFLSANDWWSLAIIQSFINSIFFRWRSVVWGLTLQFIFGLIILRWQVGRQVFQCLGDKMTTFLGFTENGSSFVYGFLIEEGVFMFKILSVIFFFSFMTRFLQETTFLVNQSFKLTTLSFKKDTKLSKFAIDSKIPMKSVSKLRSFLFSSLLDRLRTQKG